MQAIQDVWREEQLRRIASLEAEFVKSCRSVGSSHETACTIRHNEAVKCEIATKQAEESKYWDTLRYEKAIHKVSINRSPLSSNLHATSPSTLTPKLFQERELNKWREREECFPIIQRKIVEKVSNIERTFAHSHRPKSEPHEKEKKVYGNHQSCCI